MTADLDGRALAGLDAGALLLALLRTEHERDEARAALLAASDAADAACSALPERWADGYRAGFAAGSEVGNGRAAYVEARCAESHDVGQHGIADHEIDAARRAMLADLDAKRYPSHDGRPAGRVGWLTDNLGGLWHSWAAYCAEGGE